MGHVIPYSCGSAGESALSARIRTPPARTAAWLAFAVAAGILVTATAARADRSAMVVDGTSGEVLYAYHPDTPHRPASLAKMMTLYLAFEALTDGRLQPRQELVVSRRAAHQRPSRLGLVRGRRITVEDAVLALVTKSANDAAVVIAEALAGSEPQFAHRMTRRAGSLGLTHTVFRNASGLHHRDQWTTARDMARLAVALVRDFPAAYRYFATTDFTWNGRRYENHNGMLGSYGGVDGIKTGFIRQSGYNLVASAERDGRRLIGVVLGGADPDRRDWQMTRLLDFGFRRLAGDEAGDRAPPLPYLTTTPELIVPSEAIAATFRDPSGQVSGRAAGGTGSAGDNDGDAANWSIQVGAYSTPGPASDALTRIAARAPSLLGAWQPQIIPVERDGERLYRARLIGMTEDEARQACRRLAGLDIPCLAMISPATALALTDRR